MAHMVAILCNPVLVSEGERRSHVDGLHYCKVRITSVSNFKRYKHQDVLIQETNRCHCTPYENFNVLAVHQPHILRALKGGQNLLRLFDSFFWRRWQLSVRRYFIDE